MVGGSKMYAPFGKQLCILCILDQFFYIWDNFDPQMQFTAPILLITLSNHLLRKGDLFFRKRGERRKKETPLILYTKFRDMEQKSLYQNSARTGSHYISSAYTVIGSFFLISSQEQPTHLSTWMANKDRNSIPLKYNKQKARFPRI